jgi:hypothetical protein
LLELLRLLRAELGQHDSEDAGENVGRQPADRQPPPGPLRVSRVEQRDAVLRRPGEPVQEPLLARLLLRGRLAGQPLGTAGVERPDVEEAVELRGRGRQVRERAHGVPGRRGEVTQVRPRPAHERADLLAEGGLRVAEEGRDRGVRAIEPPDRRPQRLERRAQQGREAVNLVQRLLGAPQSAGEPGHRQRDVRALAGSGGEDVARGRDEPLEVVGVTAHLLDEDRVVVDEALEGVPALGGGTRHAGEVAVQRLEPAQHLAEIVAAPLEALAEPGDEQPQVVALIDVQGGVDLVGVHVGRRVPDRDRAALGYRRSGAGVDLEEHVLERRLRTEQGGRTAADDVLVLRLDLELEVRHTVFRLDVGYLADLDAGDPHGLPLPRLRRLRVLELDEDLLGLLLDEGEAQALLAEDVAGHTERQHDEAENGQEVAQVLADRVRHRLSFFSS